jgi:CRISPR-associated protein Cst1
VNSITLYPSNWLYNAGVIGLLRVLGRLGENIQNWIEPDGTVQGDLTSLLVPKQIDTLLKVPSLGWAWLLESYEQEQVSGEEKITEQEQIIKIWGKLFNTRYRGFFNANTRYLFTASKTSKSVILQFAEFLESLSEVSENKVRCSFCLRESNATFKNIFTSEHSKLLGASASDKGVPNSFWNANADQSLHICDLCSFIVLCHHLAFTRLSDGSEIFINAPSFKVMYYLNKFAREIFGASSVQEARGKREILAMSIIEYATKIQTTLGVWTGMNIEVITKRGDEIEFFSLPYEVIQIISDRRIASLLSQIGEFAVLNLVLAQDFARLMEMGYRLLRSGLKPNGDRGNSIKDFANQTLRLRKNQGNPAGVAEKIFQLCVLIEEKHKRR